MGPVGAAAAGGVPRARLTVSATIESGPSQSMDWSVASCSATPETGLIAPLAVLPTQSSVASGMRLFRRKRRPSGENCRL